MGVRFPPRVSMREKIFLFLFLILLAFLFINPVRCSLSNGVNFDLPPHQYIGSGGLPLKKYPSYIKGVYLTSWTASDQRRIDYFIDLVNTTELNAVIIDIKEVDGKIAFDTQSPLIDELGTEEVMIHNLNQLIDKFHKENIYAIARIVVFKDKVLPKIKPEWALKDKQGGVWHDWAGRIWLNPTSKEVWDYHIELAKGAVRAGFDEINFDYIRFPSDGDISQIDYSQFGNLARNSASYNEVPKAELMEEFFKYLSQELKPTGAFLSADLFGLTLWNEGNNDMNIGQILELALPYFDFICPMVYPSHYPDGFENFSNPAAYPYEIIKINLEKGQKRLIEGGAKIRPWLQDFDMGAIYDKRMINLQKQAVYDTDSYGWMLWNSSNRYTEEALERN